MSKFFNALRMVVMVSLHVVVQTQAQAQAWPVKPVKIVVGYPAGGSADRMARMLTVPLARYLGQPVLVENKVGASGIAASEYVLNSSDGHTILLHSTGGISVRPHVVASLRYNPKKDFVPVSTVTVVPTVFVGSLKLPARSFTTMLDYARANPGKLNIAIPGAGTTNHLFGAVLKKQTGIKAQDIPYAGAAPALQALMAGDADLLNIDITNVVTLALSQKIVPYAIASDKRSPFLPDVPTTVELGYPGIVGNNTWAVYVSVTMPKAAIERLREALSAALKDPQVKQSFATFSMVPMESSSALLVQMTEQEEDRLLPLIKELNLKLE